jgi:hypothetical protein
LSSILQTVPTLHQVIITCFSISEKVLAGESLWSDQETKGVLQEWLKGLTATFFDECI